MHVKLRGLMPIIIILQKIPFLVPQRVFSALHRLRQQPPALVILQNGVYIKIRPLSLG